MVARKKRDEDGTFDLIGFAPDLDPTIPGACSVMSGVIPITGKGWRAAPSLDRSNMRFTTPTAATAFSQAHFSPTGVVFLRAADQIIRTNAQMTASSTITGSTTINVTYPSTFIDFGLLVLMANPGHTIAVADTSVFGAAPTGTFAPIAGAPQSMLITAANRFVLAFDLTDGWACCARDNHSSWTANPATLAAFGRLPGRVDDLNRAVAPIGDDIILFKGEGAYLGRFVPNHDEVWVWEMIPGLRLQALHYAAASYKNGALVLAHDGLYYYNGGDLINLMDERMSRWFARRNVAPTYSSRVVVDEVRDLIWIKALIYDDDTDTSTPTYSIYIMVCDPKTKRWSRFYGGESLGAISAGFNRYPSHWAGGIYIRSGLQSVWGFPVGTTAAATVPQEIAAPATANATTQIVANDMGHPFIDSELTQAHLKFITAPTGATVTVAPMQRNTLDGSLSTAAPVARTSNGGFDIRQNARWHRLKFDLTGDFEIGSEAAVDLKPTGMR